MADNRLGGGDEGTKEICKMLTLNRNLKRINLSGNGGDEFHRIESKDFFLGNKFSDADTEQLVDAFEVDQSIDNPFNLSLVFSSKIKISAN